MKPADIQRANAQLAVLEQTRCRREAFMNPGNGSITARVIDAIKFDGGFANIAFKAISDAMRADIEAKEGNLRNMGVDL